MRTYWAAYYKEEKKCTPQTNIYASGLSHYQTTMAVLGIVLGVFAIAGGTTGSCLIKKRRVENVSL
jgi:hypothetical protein